MLSTARCLTVLLAGPRRISARTDFSRGRGPKVDSTAAYCLVPLGEQTHILQQNIASSAVPVSPPLMVWQRIAQYHSVPCFFVSSLIACDLFRKWQYTHIRPCPRHYGSSFGHRRVVASSTPLHSVPCGTDVPSRAPYLQPGFVLVFFFFSLFFFYFFFFV